MYLYKYYIYKYRNRLFNYSTEANETEVINTTFDDKLMYPQVVFSIFIFVNNYTSMSTIIIQKYNNDIRL